MEVKVPYILEQLTKGFLNKQLAKFFPYNGGIAVNEILSKTLTHGMETDTYRRNITAAQKSKRSSQIFFQLLKIKRDLKNV